MLFNLFDFTNTCDINGKELVFLIRSTIVGYGKFTNTAMPLLDHLENKLEKTSNGITLKEIYVSFVDFKETIHDIKEIEYILEKYEPL